ncbi:BTB/POZ fold protein [Cordyceps fumosorosea ARSEF 2679]|uniref:BTB/POZ fold protein n=1 Tax=Cordyceps fumosorosea (strain ARSEF 2679) TaxID=1081104 RepID=A0A168AJ36_CORFA|nr:BTB/POZ fold protein [Cordyceps fumosorosea ARSEF 2679]OAA68818.1 BTB/POZ fold protein [Cordyceps fumosorosea ARSEF 2679]
MPQTREASKTAATPEIRQASDKTMTTSETPHRLKKGGMPDYAFKVILAMHKGEFCDYQIKCGQRTFKINRAIVGVQSPVLRVHLKKRKPDFYEIHDFSGDVVEKAIEFFSRRRYEAPGAPGSAGSGDSAGFHMEMYCFAQKYKVSGLGTLAIRKFSAEVRAIKDIEELVEVIISVYKRQEEVGTLKEYLLYPLQVFKPAARGCSDADRGLELLKLKCPDFFFDYVVQDLKKQWKRSRRAG